LQTVATFASTAPYFVSPSFQVVLSGGTLTQITPYAAVYLAPDSGGNLQAWQLSLTNTASLPVPVQTGLISGAPFASTTICGSSTGSRNLTQPTTGFGILQYAVSPNTCGSGAVTVLINSTDSSTTAPTAVPISQTDFHYLYLSSGVLSAILGLDPATGHLNYYAAGSGGAPSFSAPTALVTGAASADLIDISFNRNRQITDTVAFALVSYSGSPAPASKLWRVAANGSASAVYTASGTVTIDLEVRDNTNLYFTDAVPSGGSTIYNIYAAPIAGGNASAIAAVTAAAGTTYTLVDSDGTSLVIKATAASGTTLYKLATAGPSSQTPVQILTTPVLGVTAGLDFASGDLFVNERASTTTTGVVLKPSGSSPATPIAGPLASTAFGTIWNESVAQSTNWPEIAPLPNDGTYGGAQIKLVSIANLTQSTTFTCPMCGSGNYSIPAGGDAGIGQFGTAFAYGEVTFPSTSAATLGLLLNLQTAQLAEYGVSVSNVTLFY